MKNLILTATLSLLTFSLSAQEWGTVEKNNVTLKEMAPVWEGCEAQSGAGIQKCFTQKLTQHVIKNFKYPADAYKSNTQGRVIVEFIINTEGLVEIKKVSGGAAALQEEARRNISLIPKMVRPGMYAGKPKAIQYTVPFDFKTGK